jgi:DNA-binding MarR family transcriptional regulator
MQLGILKEVVGNRMSVSHLEIYSLAERLHRQFLDVVQAELDRNGRRDINSVGAMIVYNVGDEEMTVSDLMWRGCYLGTNVSYNLKKLTESGHLTQVKSSHDKRVILIRNSPKGLEVCRQIRELEVEHQAALNRLNLNQESIMSCANTLGSLQKYWGRTLDAARSRFPLAVAA